MNMAKKDINLTGRVVMTLIAAVIITLLYPSHRKDYYNYEVGRPWNYAQLIAPFDIPVRADSATVAAGIDSLRQIFVPVYSRKAFDVKEVVARLADSLPAADRSSANAFASRLGERLTGYYNRGVISDSVRAASSKVRMLDGKMLTVTPSIEFMSIREVYNRVEELAKNEGRFDLLQSSGILNMLTPNIVFNAEENNRLLANEEALIAVDRGVIQRGQTIINKGAIVSRQDYTNLRTYEEMIDDHHSANSRSAWLIVLGQFVYAVMLLGAFMACISVYRPKLWADRRSLVYLLCLTLIFMVLSTALLYVSVRGIYLAPLAIVPVMVLVFFDAGVALLTLITTVLVCAPLAVFGLEYIALEVVAGCTALLSLRELTHRAQLLHTSVVVILSYLATYLAVLLMTDGSFESFSWQMMGMLAISGALVSVTYVLMFMAERLFGFVSKVTLVELADTNSDLLRKLGDECPGTLQHSQAVSSLADAAARSIGADYLLVRAGALYHDIGKMDNPVFFTENQHGVNPHDGLPPERSARIIIGHITDGLRRAEQEKLPVGIRDFISQHHGRGLAKYFYYTACKANPDQYVDPAPFTYPGPNPQTREASVVMMADAVEAASRSLKDTSAEAISALVDKIVDQQIADGLHDESTLSFRDVARIKRAFVKRLTTIYHSRIAYPDAPAKNS